MSNQIEISKTTRRTFLGAAALTAASYSRVLGANDRPNIGFIGFGLIGKQHVSDFKKLDVNLVAMCETYKPRMDEGLALMGNPSAKGYSDFRKMYENKDIDGVVVSTPDHWHALLTIMACAAGKDVYVEKPMTVFNDEGKWMIQAARQYKRIVTVGTQRRHGAGVKAAKADVIQKGTLGKIHAIRWGSARNVYPGFGKTPVSDPPPGFDYDMWLGPAEKKPYTNHRGIYHFRWFWDYSGGQMTNLGAHTIDQVLYLMDAKGPSLVMSNGGRYALEDDGETPDIQDAIWQFPATSSRPGFVMNAYIREACVGPRDGGGGQAYLGNKGVMSLSGAYRITTEQKIDPVNDIPKFLGHPVGGPVYTDVKPAPFLTEAQTRSGGVASDARYGLGGEDTMLMNEKDWVDCIKSRNKPFCEVEEGHRVAVCCNLANMSLKLGRAIKWDPEKEVVIGDKEAQAMCTKQYRAPWDAALKACIKV